MLVASGNSALVKASQDYERTCQNINFQKIFNDMSHSMIFGERFVKLRKLKTMDIGQKTEKTKSLVIMAHHDDT